MYAEKIELHIKKCLVEKNIEMFEQIKQLICISNTSIN